MFLKNQSTLCNCWYVNIFILLECHVCLYRYVPLCTCIAIASFVLLRKEHEHSNAGQSTFYLTGGGTASTRGVLPSSFWVLFVSALKRPVIGWLPLVNCCKQRKSKRNIRYDICYMLKICFSYLWYIIPFLVVLMYVALYPFRYNAHALHRGQLRSSSNGKVLG